MQIKLPTTLFSTLSRPRSTGPTPTIFPRPCYLNNPTSIRTVPPPSASRTYNTTFYPSAKGPKREDQPIVPPNTPKAQDAPTADVSDFSRYEAAIKRVHEVLHSELAKIKPGGRNAGEIEELRVVLGKNRGGDGKDDDGSGAGTKGNGNGKGKGSWKGKADPKSVKLGDVASVVARGRNVGVLVGEKAHLKPVLSALASLPSLSYTASPTDPLTLTVAIPPVTAESRLEAKTRGDKKGQQALDALRDVRGTQRKILRSMELKKLIRPDDLRRAQKEVDKLHEMAQGEAARMVQACRKGLEGG